MFYLVLGNQGINDGNYRLLILITEPFQHLKAPKQGVVDVGMFLLRVAGQQIIDRRFKGVSQLNQRFGWWNMLAALVLVEQLVTNIQLRGQLLLRPTVSLPQIFNWEE